MPLQTVRTIHRMQSLSKQLLRRGKAIGFVPTMGALHEGHASLIRKARREADCVVVSIFVNPLQFGPKEDYARYPRRFREDSRIIRDCRADILFAPAAKEMYPKAFVTKICVAGPSLPLEGRLRPGHFDGVATVVAKLLEAVQPSVLYLGQKDYQQTLVIRKMIEDLNLPVALRVCPTVRERGGLAMSSRNAYLDETARNQAAILYRALQAGAAAIRQGSRSASFVEAVMKKTIRQIPTVKIDYACARGAQSLAPLKKLKGRVALLGAVRLGSVRLIDNLLVDVP